ncbi:hypothetical protein BJX62DRAFT_236281 [Aspergillus germanicus]
MCSNTSQQPKSQSQASQAQNAGQQSAGSQSQSQSQTGQGNTNANFSAARPATAAARTAQTLTRRPSHPRIQALVDDAGRGADPNAMRTARPNIQEFCVEKMMMVNNGKAVETRYDGHRVSVTRTETVELDTSRVTTHRTRANGTQRASEFVKDIDL